MPDRKFELLFLKFFCKNAVAEVLHIVVFIHWLLYVTFSYSTVAHVMMPLGKAKMGSVNVNKKFRAQTAAARSVVNRQTNLMSVGKHKCKQFV